MENEEVKHRERGPRRLRRMGDSSTVVASTLITTPAALVISALVAVVVGSILSRWREAKPLGSDNLHCDLRRDDIVVPFVVLQDPNWGDISRSMERYEEEGQALMNGLSRSLEVARATEWDVFGDNPPEYLLSEQLSRRIDRLATLFEHNARLLQEQVFQPFPVTKVLPVNQPQQECRWTAARPLPDQPPHRVTVVPEESSSYDSASQVMAHITRDWTYFGRLVRQSTYDWCRDQLSDLSSGASVLVPGAGLGRLAYDLARDGYSVEANDSSLLMASAAYAILQKRVGGTLYPFLMDFFTNEVDTEQRYEPVVFPDAAMHEDMKANLSYTIGDFEETYSTPSYKGQYNGIVTCYFLDTATNIYHYLVTIHNILEKGGVWVHVGPLQWHRNALLHPSANELKGLVESMGFQVKSWSIDLEPMDYRSEDYATVRSTKYEAFKPVRMVAVKKDVTTNVFRLFRRRQNKNPGASSQNNIPSQVVIEEL
jgi:SAM-dependent methyltransferase